MKKLFSQKLSWVNKDKSSPLLRYVGYVAMMIVVFIIAMFVYGQFFTTTHRLFDGKAAGFNTGWILYDSNDVDSFNYLTLPASIDCQGKDKIEIRKVIPMNIENMKYLCILNRWNLNVYIGDELRYSYEEDSNELQGGYVKSHFTMIPISISDSGKPITLQMNVEGQSTADFNEIYYGSSTGLFYLLLGRYGPQMISAIVLFIISIMVMVSSYILIIIYRRRISIVLLAYGTAFVSLWFIFDSFLYQVLFSNYYIDGPMEYMLTMIFPYFFARYLNFEQKGRYEKIYGVACIFMLLNFTIMTYLHFACIRPYEQNLLFTGMNAVVGIILFFSTILRDTIKGYVKEYWIVAIGFSMVIVFGVIQIIVLNVSVDNHDALYLLAGVYMLLIFGLVHMIRELRIIEDFSRRQKHANELKSSFLANMSHEIRTPLNAILGMNEMIYQESCEKDIKQYSTNIRNAGNSLLDIINDILDFSKIESGKMVLVDTEYELQNMLTNLYNMMNIKAHEKDLNFIVELDSSIPSKYYGDENRIQQILINLLNNAIKYTEKGTVTFIISVVNISINAETGEKIAALQFDVKDTGIGIREEDRDKLFATFERIDIKKNRSIEGTGLGLSITNNLINLMGGMLTVDSVYGEGSTFRATIPQKIVDEGAIGEFDKIIDQKGVVEEVKRKDYVAENVRVLVVDDVKMNIRVVKGLLKKHNVEIVEALSGYECIEKYNEGEYDLVLLDHMMPEMDGIETLNLMKTKYDELCPIIMLTANAISGMKEMYISEGFDDYLAKPTKPEELDDIILKYVKPEKIRLKDDN